MCAVSTIVSAFMQFDDEDMFAERF